MAGTQGHENQQNVKGLHAQFLRMNPRFINEPICNVTMAASAAGDHMVNAALHTRWNGQAENSGNGAERHISYSYDSTSRADYKPHPLSAARDQKRGCQPQSTIKAILEQDHSQQNPGNVREKISFKHQYNCRTDPNEPVRGKLHGSFVWEKVQDEKQ